MEILAYGSSMDHYHHNNCDEMPPTLPTELLEQILTEAWLSSMSPIERASFINSISRSSKAWLATLARIATTHIYASSPCNRDWRTIDGQLPFYWRGIPENSSHLCRSFTRQITDSRENNALSLLDRVQRKAIRELLSAFHALPYMPNLCRLSIELFNTPAKLSDTNLFSFFRFPVVQLEVEYTFSTDTPSWLIDELGLTGKTKQCKTKTAPWELSDLYHISTPTIDPASLGDILKLCSHLELSEESYGIRIKILSASHFVHNQAAIIHGPVSIPFMSRSKQQEAILGREGPDVLIVQGKALGVVFDMGPKKGRWQNLADTSRNVHVFRQRTGWY